MIYHLIENAISAEEQSDILRFFEANKEPDPREGWEFCPLKELNKHLFNLISFNDVQPEVQSLVKIVEYSKKYFLDNYQMNHVFEYKRGFMGSMQSGASLGVHSDNDDLYGGRRQNEKHYSGLLFLTDDYVGGELIFPEFKIALTPPARSLLLFDGKNRHGVNTVISGRRINYVLFFKDYNPSDEVIITEFDAYTYDTRHGAGTS